MKSNKSKKKNDGKISRIFKISKFYYCRSIESLQNVWWRGKYCLKKALASLWMGTKRESVWHNRYHLVKYLLSPYQGGTIPKLRQHILDCFWPTHYNSIQHEYSTEVSKNDNFPNPPTQSFWWRNIGMIPKGHLLSRPQTALMISIVCRNTKEY